MSNISYCLKVIVIKWSLEGQLRCGKLSEPIANKSFLFNLYIIVIFLINTVIHPLPLLSYSVYLILGISSYSFFTSQLLFLICYNPESQTIY